MQMSTNAPIPHTIPVIRMRPAQIRTGPSLVNAIPVSSEVDFIAPVSWYTGIETKFSK